MPKPHYICFQQRGMKPSRAPECRGRENHWAATVTDLETLTWETNPWAACLAVGRLSALLQLTFQVAEVRLIPGNLRCLWNSRAQDVLWTSDLSLILCWKTYPLLEKCYVWGSLPKGPKLHLFSFFSEPLRLAFNLQPPSNFGLLYTAVSVHNHAQTYSWEVGKKKAWGGEAFISSMVFSRTLFFFFFFCNHGGGEGNHSYCQLSHLQ